jgi:hypothetical protein
MRTWFVLVIVLAACSGDAPPSSGKCVGAPYDPCNEEHDCMSQLCQNFMGDGFQVCSQMCDDTNPCPGAGECNMMGICKPAAPNDCEL